MVTAALLTYSWPKGRWLPVLRPYTPISDLGMTTLLYISFTPESLTNNSNQDQQGSISLMVKHYPNGKASTHLHTLQPGDTLTFAATQKGYPWTPNKFSQIYLIAGGAGITPIYQLIQGILNNPHDKTKISLIFGVNTEQDLLLREA